MTLQTACHVGKRIADHAVANGIDTVEVLLHGGEPLLLGLNGLTSILDAILSGASDRVDILFGIQTNGLLLNHEILGWAEAKNVNIGVSCDGPPDIANVNRIDHQGRGSGNQLEKALLLLKGHPRFSGLLCVINPESMPSDVWSYLVQWQPPMVDFLLPHHTWQDPPPYSLSGIPIYGEWLSEIFDIWISSGPHSITVRYLEEIIGRSMGGSGSLESLGEEPVTLLVINVDGEYEGVDSLKASHPESWVTNMNVYADSVQDVLHNELIALRQSGADQLAEECLKCKFRKVCGGGYLPHRYHPKRGFRSPSVFCKDIKHAIHHVQDFMAQAADS
jgi:uncharacterized protein